jgi:small-conductance mechanosensitive channel
MLVLSSNVLRELNALQALAPFLAGAGIVSVIIGLGAQTFIRDFVSGLFIVGENQYRVGDVVEIGGGIGIGTIEGTVTRISTRTTTLRDADGALHVIPNGGIMRAANKTLDSAKVNIEVTLTPWCRYRRVRALKLIILARQ